VAVQVGWRSPLTRLFLSNATQNPRPTSPEKSAGKTMQILPKLPEQKIAELNAPLLDVHTSIGHKITTEKAA